MFTALPQPSAPANDRRRRRPRRPQRVVLRSLTVVLLGAGLLLQAACGTLLYPERRGQQTGRIDPAVAIMNGIGLLLFLIPGLIAFAVDFSTGAIYLPPGEGADASDEPRVVYLEPDQITPETLSAVIHKHTGREITLTDHDLRVLRQVDPEDLADKLAALNQRDR